MSSFTQPPSGRRRMRICFADVFCFLFFFVFFPSVKNMRKPFSGTAERIFMKLLPNDRGEMQWRSRTFGRPVRWSNLPPFCLGFGNWQAPREGEFSRAPRCLGPRCRSKILKKVFQIASFWPPQICNMHKIHFRPGSAPDPDGGAYDAPWTPNRVVRGQ